MIKAKRKGGLLAAERKELMLKLIEKKYGRGIKRSAFVRGKGKPGERISQALQILRERGPITEDSIRNLTIKDFGARGITIPWVSYFAVKRNLLRKFKRGELK